MTTLLSFIKKPAKAAVRLYYKTTHWPPVWRLLNKEALDLYKKHTPQLNKVQQRLVQDLNETGIAITHIDELFPDENLFPELLSYAKKYEEGAETKTVKEFLKFYFDAFPKIDLENPFVQLGLRNNVLDVVNTYMEMFSKFYYFTLNKTMPRGEHSKAIQSMRWHRDPEDAKMVKVFMYLNDIDKQAGPFVHIPGTHWEGKNNNLFPSKPPRGSLPPPEEIQRMFPENVCKVCVAKAGTIIFCNTRGIHRGGHALTKERIMLTLGYRSPASPWPLRYRYPDRFKEILKTKKLGFAQQYALDNFNKVGVKVLKY